ncbi:MAG: T9SS type A sorting domain-containing protein [Muribaculaceae bacterium]|nr:T9SS type A sorting domain-containing protein [Muribaculaceae bacterium]
MNARFIILSIILACFSIQGKATNLISSKIEQSGVWKDNLSPILGYDPIKVVLNDPKIKGEWDLEMLDKWDHYKNIPGVQTFDGYCLITPEILKNCWWQDIAMEYDECLNRDLFILRLSFTDEAGNTESIILKWGLIPTRPIVSDVKFTYKYNWEWDDIWPNGHFIFKVESQDAERLEYNVTNSFQFGPPFFFAYYYEIESQSPAIVDYDADWGEFIQVGAGNKYGFSHSEIICTTDYITDPEILNRIQEIAAVENLEGDTEDPILNINNETITFSIPINITIYDISGKQIFFEKSTKEVSTSSFSSGIYLVSYRNAETTFTLKYLKK